ncbi:MAG: HAD-IA family hydrolase [Actinomycetota bacterium]|nr:HAD-IA family hydrolase [Actinomycetota bacterium]
MGGLTVVLLDALGTILELEKPWPHLVRELAERGTRVTEEQAREAMLAEMAFYRAEHHRAQNQDGLARLRRECAEIVRAHLGPAAARAGIEDVEAALLAAVRFVAYPDVAPALEELRADGAQLVVVSNWDVSLHTVLAKSGLSGLLDGAISSAEAGAAKPDPVIFAAGLALVGQGAEDALMVGDSVACDITGAQAAGIAPVLVRRVACEGLGSFGAGQAAPAGVPILPGLAGLPELVRYRR